MFRVVNRFTAQHLVRLRVDHNLIERNRIRLMHRTLTEYSMHRAKIRQLTIRNNVTAIARVANRNS